MVGVCKSALNRSTVHKRDEGDHEDAGDYWGGGLKSSCSRCGENTTCYTAAPVLYQAQLYQGINLHYSLPTGMQKNTWAAKRGGGFRGSQNHINHTYATQFTNQQRQKWLVLFPADAEAGKPLKLACPSMLGSFTRWRMYNKIGSHCFASIKELFQFSIFKNVFKLQAVL